MNTEKKRILVIDDNRSDLVMARFLIQREGWESHLLDNQAKSIQTIKDFQPHIILMDLEMPGLSGFDVLKRIKRETSLNKIPIVILSGHSESENVKSAIGLGAVDYIIKPLDPELFSTKIKKHLNLEKTDIQKQWTEYDIPSHQQNDIELFISARILTFGEVSFCVSSQVPVPIGTCLYLKFAALKSLGLGDIPVQVASSMQKGDKYEITFNIVGIDEEDLQKIRLFCQKL